MLHKIYSRATEVYLKNGNLIESAKDPTMVVARRQFWLLHSLDR